jgi:ADP-ribose pyrophosphatase
MKEETLTMVKPQKKQQDVVYETPYRRVYSQEVDFGSFTKEYFVIDFGEKAGLVVVRDNSLLLVRQYRLLVNQLSWEIPGGKIDAGEAPQESAARECFEETGVKCRNLKPLLNYHQTLEGVNAFTHLFYARDFEDNNNFVPNRKEVESIAWIPSEQCFEMIKEGKILDSFSILALLAYRTFVEQK